MTPPRITDPDEVRRRIAAHGRWWHCIELAPGIVTPGEDSNRDKLPVLEGLGLPERLDGVRALDIGCSDGYFAFELERRGADVMAIDFVDAAATGFAVAKAILGSRVEYRVDSVYNLRPQVHGRFDLVFFLGVLYHLRKPLAALDAVRSVLPVGGQLYVATFLIDEHVALPDGGVTTLERLNPKLRDIPLWQACPRDSLNGDWTNCFAPNLRALQVALEEAEFAVEASIARPGGGFVRATAVADPMAAKYRDLDGRLCDTPFDPSVPYFLDEEGSVHDLTGRREVAEAPPAPTEADEPARPGRWRRLTARFRRR
ncbi:MAG TPA: methyltransferase domain-containing protein [Methylomirabilota bacterium]|nr:methyltransferase domain-containing protein [Methylomirabilota bacterium]